MTAIRIHGSSLLLVLRGGTNRAFGYATGTAVGVSIRSRTIVRKLVSTVW